MPVIEREIQNHSFEPNNIGVLQYGDSLQLHQDWAYKLANMIRAILLLDPLENHRFAAIRGLVDGPERPTIDCNIHIDFIRRNMAVGALNQNSEFDKGLFRTSIG